MNRLACVALFLIGCQDPADFRPARGVESKHPVKESYRVPAAPAECVSLGFIKRGKSLDDIAATAAAHGASHYVVVNDASGTEYETTSSGIAHSVGPGLAISSGSSTTRANKTHEYTAEAFSCPE